MIKHLFTPFTQLDFSTTKCCGGSGLGLAISKSIVELFRWQIYAESREGDGSVFHVEPVLSKASEEVCQPQPEDPADRNSKIPKPARELAILLVEDNEVNQMLFKKILEIRNLSFDLAENGQ